MIISTGIDIIEVHRIRDTIARTPRFLDRVYTANERAYCEGKGEAMWQSYAGRYAAKEAFLKALKTGWRGKITWHDVEIVSDPDGVPLLNVTGEAKKILAKHLCNRTHLSISHTKDHAIAQVILEKV